MLEYIDRFVDIRLIENLAVDAHVAGYGINVHRIAAGRNDALDDRLIVVKTLLAQHDNVSALGRIVQVAYQHDAVILEGWVHAHAVHADQAHEKQ